jgi:hypothetical protein
VPDGGQTRCGLQDKICDIRAVINGDRPTAGGRISHSFIRLPRLRGAGAAGTLLQGRIARYLLGGLRPPTQVSFRHVHGLVLTPSNERGETPDGSAETCGLTWSWTS